MTFTITNPGNVPFEGTYDVWGTYYIGNYSDILPSDPPANLVFAIEPRYMTSSYITTPVWDNRRYIRNCTTGDVWGWVPDDPIYTDPYIDGFRPAATARARNNTLFYLVRCAEVGYPGSDYRFFLKEPLTNGYIIPPTDPYAWDYYVSYSYIPAGMVNINLSILNYNAPEGVVYYIRSAYSFNLCYWADTASLKSIMGNTTSEPNMRWGFIPITGQPNRFAIYNTGGAGYMSFVYSAGVGYVFELNVGITSAGIFEIQEAIATMPSLPNTKGFVTIKHVQTGRWLDGFPSGDYQMQILYSTVIAQLALPQEADIDALWELSPVGCGNLLPPMA